MASFNPVVLITGANTGLGYEIVKSLSQSPTAYTILVGSRSIEKGESAISKVKIEVPSTKSTYTVIQADIESDSSIQKIHDTISTDYGKLDVLINNAGASFGADIAEGKLGLREGWNKSWDTNVSGTHVLTTTLVPLLLKSSDPRLIFMTSGTSPLAETERYDGPMFGRLNASPPAGWPKDGQATGLAVYRSTKTGLNMMMREWYRILKNDNVKTWAVSPGFLATNLGGLSSEQLRKMGAKDPSEGGNFVRDVVEGKRDQDVGKAIRFDMIQPW